MHFLYPAHPLRPAVVEPTFADEFDSIRAAGFSTSVFADVVINQNKPLRNIPVGATVVYRGWMFNSLEYQRFLTAITDAEAAPLTSHEQYLNAHHLPNWYPLISEFTPETRWFDISEDVEARLRDLGWKEFFVKDYVKSLKTSRGSIISDPAEISSLIADMKHFRGEIEGGICVRRVEQFVHGSETRYFVLNGKVFAPNGNEIPIFARQIAAAIDLPFFSIDLIQRADGSIRVVEIGDGQVSDLTGWRAATFARIFS